MGMQIARCSSFPMGPEIEAFHEVLQIVDMDRQIAETGSFAVIPKIVASAGIRPPTGS